MKLIKFDKPGKYEILIPFDKEGETKTWTGIVDARAGGEYEVRVVADHKAENTSGRITLKGVAGARATVKLYGMIRIRKEAQMTDDYLELRVLCLDPTARAVAEPELEIEANNVKASHGATVGPVDPEQILYLMSRGISKIESERVIVEGFLSSDKI